MVVGKNWWIGKLCDDRIAYDLAFIDWMLEGGKSQIQFIGLS